MSIITISSIFNFEYDDYKTYCNTVISDFITTTPFEDTLDLYIYLPIWLRYRDTPIKFNNDDKGKDDFLRNFNNQLTEVVFDFHNYAKENIDYFLYQNDTTKQGKPMSKTITSGIAPINQKIDQAVDSTNLASGTGSQFVSETVYNGIAWHKLVEGYFTPNRKTTLLKAFQWLFVSVYSPETKYNDKIGIKATVPLDMADGDQVIVPDKDYLTYDQVTVEKPSTMIPENIVKDIDIGGVIGNFEVKIYPRIYDVLRLDFPDGFIVYNTPSGYDGIEGVTISIPSSAVAENIKDGVNIGGIIGSYTGEVDYLVNSIQPENSSLFFDYTNNDITALRASAFFNCKNIRSFSSTSITTLPTNAQTFAGATNLTSIDLPNLTTASGDYTFQACGLTSVYLPSLTVGGYYMFQDCTDLISVNLPSLQGLYTKMFSGCSSLTTVNIPAVNLGGSQVFYNCTALTTISFPNAVSTTASNMFEGCTALETCNLGKCYRITNYAFYGCTSLTNLTLEHTAVVALQNINAFGNATQPITVHVPSSLISSYQTATNWSTLYNNGRVVFVAI